MMLREGYYAVAAACGVTLLATWAVGAAAWPLWLSVFLAGYVFRQTRRQVPPAPLAVVCPIDGIVDCSWQTRGTAGAGTVIAIRIKSPFLGELAIRAPIEGKVVKEWFLASGELPQGKPQAPRAMRTEDADIVDEDLQRRRYRAWIRTDEGDDVVTSVAGSVLRPHWYVRAGQRVGQGQVAGMFWFTGAVTVMIPGNSRVLVQPGTRVRSGCDILANLVRKTTEKAA